MYPLPPGKCPAAKIYGFTEKHTVEMEKNRELISIVTITILFSKSIPKAFF